MQRFYERAAAIVVIICFLNPVAFAEESVEEVRGDGLSESRDESRNEAISAEKPAVFRDSSSRVIELDETVISGNQELPKVLYILPWRQPEGLPDIELETEFTELSVFRRLYPPAYRRELEYFRNLESTVNQAAKSQ